MLNTVAGTSDYSYVSSLYTNNRQHFFVSLVVLYSTSFRRGGREKNKSCEKELNKINEYIPKIAEKFVKKLKSQAPVFCVCIVH